jgi:membrane-associated phospholipid phosphatase
MEQRLIAPAWRRPALVGASLGLAVFLSLAVLVFHARRTGFDTWAFRVLPEHIAPSRTQFLIGFTEPAISVVLLALTVVLAAATRRVRLVVLAVVGPALGTALASDVAKPFIHRSLFETTSGSYPSGHETGVTCTATVLLIAFGQLPVRRAAKVVLAAVLTVWVAVAAVALTRFYYHYATDTIGAIGLSVAFVFGLAALLDRYWPSGGRPAWLPTRAARPARPDGPARPLPSRRPRPASDEPEAQLTPRS